MTTLRMDAYYYGFEPTGDEAIDKILSAVASAGKAFHHTEGWTDDVGYELREGSGKTPVEWIQNAANEAAAERLAPTPPAPTPQGEAPRPYVCTGCGASGCKLWRDYKTFADQTRLLCLACGNAAQPNKPRESYPHGTDTIGWLVPAVPAGDTFWGYTSVPQDRVEWWKALPDAPPPPATGEAASEGELLKIHRDLCTLTVCALCLRTGLTAPPTTPSTGEGEGVLAEALQDLVERATRARSILTASRVGGGNWGMLDTQRAESALAAWRSTR